MHEWAVYALVVLPVAAVAVVSTVRRRIGGEDENAKPGSPSTNPVVFPSKQVRPKRPPASPSFPAALKENWEIIAIALPIFFLAIYFVFFHVEEPARQPLQQKKAAPLQYSCSDPGIDERLRPNIQAAGVKGDGPHDWISITTSSENAHRLFSKGLEEAWNFNQIEAGKNFELALTLDPQCAMCKWGVAYALGPFVNKVPMPTANALYPVFSCDDLKAANRAVRQAKELLRLRQHTSLEERLIESMTERFDVAPAQPSFAPAGTGSGGAGEALPASAACDPYFRRQAEVHYSTALTQLEGAHENAVVLAMAAEALMNSIAWDYTEERNGTAALNAAAARTLQILNDALRLDPFHPLALHLRVHLLEAMPLDGLGDAEGLGGSVQAADTLMQSHLGYSHLQHMPSHAFVRVGRYADAVKANILAHEIDRKISRQCIVPYLPEHNLDVLCFAAAMAGDVRTAERYALEMRRLRGYMPAEYIAEGSDRTTAQLLWIRYAQFDKVREDLIAHGTPATARGQASYGGLEYARTVAHFSEVLALSCAIQQSQERLQREPDARDQIQDMISGKQSLLQRLIPQLESLAAKIPEDVPTKPGAGVGIYSIGYHALGQVHVMMAKARVAMLEGRYDEAVDLLNRAVTVEGGLGYTEPPRLHHPVRHCLEYTLLQAERWQDAAAVATRDLAEWPRNGWSLLALAQAHQKLGNQQEADQYSAEAAAAFSDASAHVTNPCPAFRCRA